MTMSKDIVLIAAIHVFEKKGNNGLKMTKYEKIKELTEEELIELLLAFESGNMNYCSDFKTICDCDNDCDFCLRKWLESEYDDGVSFYY